ncbi:SusC/RagA family TonB-linked outer membrane protein [Halosquirtibacter xylanolyticus]|uniref:SusC/RagA family TonB-linked outer membrane protein n=1 Tax=Halosquirtibacter xylanolyticus TaxID=3374599 RepID=UPI0037492D67|nr:SusC/RagA family TonB-linked outer membrane protein [Prolixibacteraceae bacterium]
MNNIYRVILISACILYSIGTMAQRIEVYDGVKHIPLANVDIKSKTGEVVTTNEKGAADISSLIESKFIYFRKEGYQSIDYPLSNGIKKRYYLYEEDILRINDKFGDLWNIEKDTEIDHSDYSFDRSVRGQHAGVQARGVSGLPGMGYEIKIHGVRSMNLSNSPLLIIDGIIYPDNNYKNDVFSEYVDNIYANVNPSDIKSIQYLKGAAAAIYGTSGVNGAIVIETHRTKSLKTAIHVEANYGVSDQAPAIPLLNADDWRNKIYEVLKSNYTNREIQQQYRGIYNDVNNADYHTYKHDTDWQNEIYQRSVFQKYLVNVMGGDAIARYYLSIGMNNEKGVIQNTDNQAYTARLNTDINLSKTASVAVNIGYNYKSGHLVDQSYSNNNPLQAAFFKSPVLGPYKRNYNGESLLEWDPYHSFNVSNPNAIIKDNISEYNGFSTVMNARYTMKIWKNIVFGANIGIVNWEDRQKAFFSGKTSKAVVPEIIHDFTALNQAKELVAKGVSFEGGINFGYERKNNRSHLLFNISSSYRTSNFSKLYAGGMNTASDKMKLLGSVSKENTRIISSYYSDYRVLNNLAKLRYTLNDRYGVEIFTNYEFNSITGSDIDSGKLYYGGALSYDIANERWFPFKSIISNLKLKGDFATSGNANIPYYMNNKQYVAQRFEVASVGFSRANIFNKDLSLEKVTQQGYGVELITPKDLFMFTAYAWKSNTDNMIIIDQIPLVTGFKKGYSNSGAMSSTGLDLGARFMIGKNAFKFMLGGSLSFVKYNYEDLGNNNSLVTSINEGQIIIKKGGSGPKFYGLKMLGVYTDQTEVDQYNLITSSGLKYEAGDVIFQDTNEDHIINEKDAIEIGDPLPDFTGGVYGSIQYKDLTLSATMSFVEGGDIFNYTRLALESQSTTNNQSSRVMNGWKFPGQKTDMPKASWGDPHKNNQFSSRWIEDGTYWRLDDVTLSYRLPIGKAKGRKNIIYVKGKNLITKTQYLGLDPDIVHRVDSQSIHGDYGKIPSLPSIILGVNLSL